MHHLKLWEFAAVQTDDVESYSPFCLKVRRALQHAGMQFEEATVTNPAAVKKLNPAGQVPVLEIGNEVVVDSTDILARIEELSSRPLRPHLSVAQQAEALLWEEFADTSVNVFVVAARWADEGNWPRSRAAFFGIAPALIRGLIARRVRSQVMSSLHGRNVWRQGAEPCWRRFEQLLDQLESRAPAEGFWVAASLSTADIALFAQLHSLRTELTPEQATSVERRSRLVAYLQRVDDATQARALTAVGAPKPQERPRSYAIG